MDWSWVSRTSGTTGHIDGLAWGDGKFVAVGTGGVLLTSPDGIAWTHRNSQTNNHLYDVAYSEKLHRFVAVGINGTITTSIDGIYWNVVPCPAPVQHLRGLTWSGGRFMAVGDYGKIIGSNDGVSWLNHNAGGAFDLNDITSFGNNQYVAVGWDGKIIYTTNGLSWSEQPSGTTKQLIAVTWNGAQFIAVGAEDTILASSTGTTWQSRSLPTTGWLDDIIWANGRYMAVRSGGRIYTSTDGLNWTQINSGTNQGLYAIAWNGSMYVATGHNGTIMNGTIITSSGRQVSRLYGADRYKTAVEVSKAGGPSAVTVLIARGDDYADALAGVPLGYKFNAPILLTQPAFLNPDTMGEIQRLGAKNAVILGGAGAVSQTVEDTLKGMGLQVSRIWGQNRFGTAAEIARQLPFQGVKTAYVVYGYDFPDALLASPFAATRGMPILLTHTDSLPPETAAVLQSMGITTTRVVGNHGVINDYVLGQLPAPVRIWGQNRYAAAVAVLNYHNFNSSQLHVATGLNFPDSMTGGVLVAKRNSGLLLVSDIVPPEIANYLQSKTSVKELVIFGGPGAVSPAVENQLK